MPWMVIWEGRTLALPVRALSGIRHWSGVSVRVASAFGAIVGSAAAKITG